MAPELLLPLFTFAVVSSITPGPNNMMMLASGVNHGLARSLPLLFGICTGFAFMLIATGLGLHAVFVRFPVLQLILKYVGAIYLLWLAWKLAHAAPLNAEQRAVSKPIGFFSGAAFQWVNPKAWVMILSTLSTYLPQESDAGDVGVLALVFFVAGLACVGSWAVFGVAMRRLLQNPRSVRVFNLTMALLLVASLYPILRS